MPLSDQAVKQIRSTHAAFIHAVVSACGNPALHGEIEELLHQAEQSGWGRMVVAVRHLLNGRRDNGIIEGLDEEDYVVIGAILDGLHNPASLPDPGAGADGSQAAPGLAHMLHHARRGDVETLQALARMAEQMTSAGGDMARIGGNFHALIEGERDADKLCRGMGSLGRGLMLSIIEELARLDSH